MSTTDIDEAIDLLERSSQQMRRDSDHSADSVPSDRAVFLKSWAHLLNARANWIFGQRIAGLLLPGEILGVAAFDIDVAKTYLDKQAKVPVQV